MNVPGYGMNKDKDALTGDYDVEQFIGEKRTFDPAKHYLWPIPDNAIDKNPNLLPNNPGW